MRKHKYLIIILFIVLCVAIPSVVIFVENHFKSEEPIKIIYIPKVIDDDNEFWSALIGGAYMAAKEYNVDLTVVAPDTEEDYMRQNELIEWAIEQKPDAIAISPANYIETTEVAKKVIQNKIKLVFIDSSVNERIEDAIVATDNFIAGKKMGEYAKRFIKEDTKIAIVGHVKTASTAIERQEGFRSALGKDEERITEVVFCDSAFGKAYNLTIDLLKKYPDINMVIGLNEYSSVGAARAIRDMKLASKVTVIGFDSSIEQIKLLEEGVFQGIVVQKPFNMGYLGIEKAVKVVTGEKTQRNVDSGSQLIVKENMYTEANQKLLFPFIGKQNWESNLDYLH